MNYYLLKLKRVALQLLFLLLCYFVSRCCLVLLNHEHFRHMGIGDFLLVAVKALRFDISALLVINALYVLLFFFPVNISEAPRWERFTQIVFIISNSVAFAFEIGDWAYFPFALKRATSDVLDMMARKGDFLSLLPHFAVDYWYVPVALAAYIWALVWVNRRIRRYTPLNHEVEPGGWVHKVALLFQLFFLGPFFVIGIRGGITNYVPIGLRDAVKVGNGDYVPVVLNTPFSIINTLAADRLHEARYMPQAEAEAMVQPVKMYPHAACSRKNVVVIIVESCSKEFTRLGSRKGYTPFLDSLMSVSYTCTNAFANALHSAEGIPAVIAGIPSFMEEPFTTSVYGTNKITSLPGVLKTQGYSSAFYHGGTNGTMSFDIFCANAGYDKYYGRKEYGNEEDYDGNWGIWDEPFLHYFAEGISKMPQPFFATVFTLSSHDPFKIPAIYKDHLPKGNIEIEQAIAYTDLSLRKFFAKAATQPWYNNTLFVITADHAAPQHDDDYYSRNMGRYAIPVIFFAPGDTALHRMYDGVTQQIDILPSVLDYLGYGGHFFALGNSVFAPGTHAAANGFQGQAQCLGDGYLLEATGIDAKGLYAYPADSVCGNNLLTAQPQAAAGRLRYLRALLQVYNNSLIGNKMWVKG